MNGRNHFTYMVLGGAGLFGALIAFGVPLQSALLFAVVLACPLMMVFMMGGHGHGHGHGHGTGTDAGRSVTESGRESENQAGHSSHQN